MAGVHRLVAGERVGSTILRPPPGHGAASALPVLGTWADLESVRAWRGTPEFAQLLGRCRELCEKFHAGDYSLAASPTARPMTQRGVTPSVSRAVTLPDGSGRGPVGCADGSAVRLPRLRSVSVGPFRGGSKRIHRRGGTRWSQSPALTAVEPQDFLQSLGSAGMPSPDSMVALVAGCNFAGSRPNTGATGAG